MQQRNGFNSRLSYGVQHVKFLFSVFCRILFRFESIIWTQFIQNRIVNPRLPSNIPDLTVQNRRVSGTILSLLKDMEISLKIQNGIRLKAKSNLYIRCRIITRPYLFLRVLTNWYCPSFVLWPWQRCLVLFYLILGARVWMKVYFGWICLFLNSSQKCLAMKSQSAIVTSWHREDTGSKGRNE